MVGELPPEPEPYLAAEMHGQGRAEECPDHKKLRSETRDDRIILFCDVERPLRTRAMTAVNRWVSTHIINESATQNEEGERVGWLNRIFGSVYQVRLVGKRMKAWNKRAYYAVKFLLIGGILAAFLASAFA